MRADAKEVTLRDSALRERGTVLSTRHARYGEILQVGSPVHSVTREGPPVRRDRQHWPATRDSWRSSAT